MVPPAGQLQASAARQAAPTVSYYVGEVVYMYAFDVAYELLRQPLKTLLGRRSTVVLRTDAPPFSLLTNPGGAEGVRPTPSPERK